MLASRAGRLTTLFAGLVLGLSMIAVDHAEARRGGSFGSRGTRTYQSAPATRTAPKPVAPVERSMTPNAAPNNPARQGQGGVQPRPGFNNGFFGGGLFRGLLLGGLFGMLLGHGFGGMAGMFGFLFQALLIGGAIWLAVRLFRSQPAPAMAGAARAPAGFRRDDFGQRQATRDDASGGGLFGGGSRAHDVLAAAASSAITLAQADLDIFEQRLSEVQEAFGREDHAALRRIATPEMVSFLSEELADNARNGVRNDVSDVRLLQADVAESWREEGDDYATAAMLYESRDVTRDRTSGRVTGGDPDRPTETTELWTFKRQHGSEWKLSAIQEA